MKIATATLRKLFLVTPGQAKIARMRQDFSGFQGVAAETARFAGCQLCQPQTRSRSDLWMLT
jgi:hypothetical protein